MDLIDRQTAIDDIRRWAGYIDSDMILRIQMSLKKIPAADVVERKRGHWIRVPLACYGGGTVTEYGCSECHETQIAQSDFCPNCGADMRGE